MPTSNPEGHSWIVKKCREMRGIKTIVDVGCGRGTFARLLKPLFPDAIFIGIEVWAPYIAKYKLPKLYNILLVDDARQVPTLCGADLVIFGDVLEHMKMGEAIDLFSRFDKYSRYTLVTLPIVYYAQGIIGNNPFERHIVPDWTHEKVLKAFPGIRLNFKGRKKGVYLT